MGRGEAPKLQVRCDECGTAFRLTLKRGRLPAAEIPCPKCKTPLDVKSQWEEHKKENPFRERPNTDNRETTLSPLHQRDSLASDAFEAAVPQKSPKSKGPAGSKPPAVPRAKIMNRKRIRREDSESAESPAPQAPAAAPRPAPPSDAGESPSGEETPVMSAGPEFPPPPVDESAEAVGAAESADFGDPTVDIALEDVWDFGDDVEEIEIGDLADVDDIPPSPGTSPPDAIDASAEQTKTKKTPAVPAEDEKQTAKMNAVQSGGPTTQPIPRVESKSRNGPSIPSLSLPKPNFKEARKKAREDAKAADEADTLQVNVQDAVAELDAAESEKFAKASKDFMAKSGAEDPDTVQLSTGEREKIVDKAKTSLASGSLSVEKPQEEAAESDAPELGVSAPAPTAADAEAGEPESRPREVAKSRDDQDEALPKIEISVDYESAANEISSIETQRSEEDAPKVYEESAEIAIFDDPEPPKSGSPALVLILILAAAGVLVIVIWLI